MSRCEKFRSQQEKKISLPAEEKNFAPRRWLAFQAARRDAKMLVFLTQTHSCFSLIDVSNCYTVNMS